jgi:hypothetical protein
VGRLSFTATDETRDGRTLPVEVWYPAETAADDPHSEYPLAGDVGFAAELAVDDAPPAGRS